MSTWALVRASIGQMLGRQRLERTEEPAAVTDQAGHVLDYDRVMTTGLVLLYAAGLEVLHRALPESRSAGLDLACGPGHFTLSLARYLGFDRILGVDLSEPMVETANANAESLELGDRCAFRAGDIRTLEDEEPASRDLVSFTDAAHHFPDVESVGEVVRSMDRIARPEGVVFVMDLVRLRTAPLTRRYVAAIGADYEARGLTHFLEDFRNSMFAAFTVPELARAIPRGSARHWVQLTPRGLPTVQIILGLPVGRKRLFLRRGLPWAADDGPVPPELRGNWRMLRTSLGLGPRRWTSPGSV